MKKDILQDLNNVINSLENRGLTKQADNLNNIFIKIAQVDQDYQSPIPKGMPTDSKPLKATKPLGGDIFGPKARKATQELKAALGMAGDESWGPAVADQIKRVFDGARVADGYKTNQFGELYNTDYSKRALAVYNAAGPVKAKIANNNYVYNLAEAVDKSGEVHTIAQPGAMSGELIKLLITLSSYQRD